MLKPSLRRQRSQVRILSGAPDSAPSLCNSSQSVAETCADKARTRVQEPYTASAIFCHDWDADLVCDDCMGLLAKVAAERAAKVKPAKPEQVGRLVYFIAAEHGPIKIGSALTPETRLRELQTASPYALGILAIARGGYEQERRYHQMFAGRRLMGEWFERCPEIEAEIASLQVLA